MRSSTRFIVQAIAIVLALFHGVAALASGKRVALVIGNSEYSHVSSLPNPANDAADIAGALERIGFVVTRGANLDDRGMRLALRDFAEAADGAEMVVVYFAGHGIEIDNTNYLIPVNAELRSDRDVEFEAVRLDAVLNAVANVHGLKVILIDACRNNPFLAEMTRTSATRSIGRGLGRIDPGGVLVGYAARGGTLALDGEGRNSPYAEALLSHIEEPGLELGKMFRKVRDTVYDLTGGYQEPFTYGSLPGEDIFLVPAAAPATPPVAAPQSPDAEIATAFAEADLTATIGGWSAFLTRFGAHEAHPLVALAGQRRAALMTRPKPDPVSRAAQAIDAELRLFAAAEEMASPRGWALFFDRFPSGRFAASARAKEAEALMSELRARAIGGNRSTASGDRLTPAMKTAAFDMHVLDPRRVFLVQQALQSRGGDVGSLDGDYGPRTRRAMEAFQRGRGLQATGVPTRVSLAALGVHFVNGSLAELYPTSGARARTYEPWTVMALEGNRRIEPMLTVFQGRPLIYGIHDGRIYAAISLGTAYDEPDLLKMLDRAGAKLVEFDTPEEEAFVFDMVRYDQTLWRHSSSDGGTGLSIGLTRGEDGWVWRSGDTLGHGNWAPGQPRDGVYGQLVPVGSPSRNDARVDRAGWAVSDRLSSTIIIEIE